MTRPSSSDAVRPPALLSIALCLALSACGGGSDPGEPAVPRLLHDETTHGPLPFSLVDLSATDLARITFTLPEGRSVVRGTSSAGERFLVRLDAALSLREVAVSFVNQSANNDHVLQILPYPFSGVGGLFVVTPMATTGTQAFTVPVGDASLGAGVFEVYSGTSVSGPPQENTFSLTFVVARR
jgi:hypothetical protein